MKTWSYGKKEMKQWLAKKDSLYQEGKRPDWP